MTVTGIIGMLMKNISIERRSDHDSCGDFPIFWPEGILPGSIMVSWRSRRITPKMEKWKAIVIKIY